MASVIKPETYRKARKHFKPVKLKNLKLDEIVSTSGTQIRAKINLEAVEEYAHAMTDGAKFPPVVVFHDGSEYILADGFHRVMAAARNFTKEIAAEIHKGTKSDALKYALSANAAHGIKRTNLDKRRSVELALKEWPKMSDRELARICAVGHPFVGDVRKEQVESDTTCDAPQSRIGGDGKTYKLPVRREEPVPEIVPAEYPTTEEARRINSAFDAIDSQEQEPGGDYDELRTIKIVWEELSPAGRTAFRKWIG